VKVARTVLRGLGGSNAPWLPDQRTTISSRFLRFVSFLVCFVSALVTLRPPRGGLCAIR
jgi:hypothetical protein